MFHLVFICCACVEHVLIIDELLCYGMFDGHYHQDTQASNNSLKIDNYVHFCPIDFREINNIHRHNPLIIFMFDVPYKLLKCNCQLDTSDMLSIGFCHVHLETPLR